MHAHNTQHRTESTAGKKVGVLNDEFVIQVPYTPPVEINMFQNTKKYDKKLLLNMAHFILPQFPRKISPISKNE